MPIQRSVLTTALFSAVLALGLSASPAGVSAQQASTGGLNMIGSLSEQDRQMVSRAEDWLNGVGTLSANFSQLDNLGGIARGTFLLSRPGKMRFEYTYPTTDFITTTGTLLFHWDSELEQESSTLVSTTPAAILLEENVKLDEQAHIRQVEVLGDEVYIALTDPVDDDEPTGGIITLVFDTEFQSLRRWTIEDAGGNTTEVRLSNIKRDESLPTRLFVFDRPKDDRRSFDRNDR